MKLLDQIFYHTNFSLDLYFTESAADDLSKGFSALNISLLIDAVIESKTDTKNIEDMIALIPSSPEIPGVPMRNTSATMHSFIQSARKELHECL